MVKLSTTLLLCLIILLGISGLAFASENNCMTCHQDFEDDDGPAHKISSDIHYVNGLGCVDCHGGDPSLDDMDDVRDSKGYRGVPDFKEVPGFCASCHSDAAYMHEHNPALPTDQLLKYKTSTHGKQLFGKGDTNVANCISCHTVHEIGDANMPHSSTYAQNIPATCGKCHSDSEHMAPYNISATQVDDYKKSVHGIALLEKNDLGAPVCNDCHGNHGAAPPGIGSVADVCGNCHALEAELFNDSPHKEAFSDNEIPMCEVCHSNHFIEKPNDAMIGIEEPALCVNCHSADDGTKGFETAKGMSESINKLVNAHNEAKLVLDEAIEKGMMTTDEEFRLKEVGQILIQTRASIHSYDLNTVLPKAEEGMKRADTVKNNSAALIDEYYFRRKGLGFATLFITVVCIALYMRIRRL